MEVCESERWKLESPLKCKVRSRMFQMIHQNFAVKKNDHPLFLVIFFFSSFRYHDRFPHKRERASAHAKRDYSTGTMRECASG